MKVAVALAISCAVLAMMNVRAEQAEESRKQVKLPLDLIAEETLPESRSDLAEEPDKMARRGGGGKGESAPPPPPPPGWGWGPPPMAWGPPMGWAPAPPMAIPVPYVPAPPPVHYG